MGKKRHLPIKKYILLCLLPGVVFLLFFLLEQKLLPSLQEISHIQCKTYANQLIDTATKKVLEDTQLTAADLLLPEKNASGYRANTVLVNQFCTQLSEAVTEELKEQPAETISIPLGAATGWHILADRGPEIPFHLQPMGTANVDYQTSFTAVGINQINYKIWLVLTIELRVVNPLDEEILTLERKLMLADLIFSGHIPERYFEIAGPHEYLLTE